MASDGRDELKEPTDIERAAVIEGGVLSLGSECGSGQVLMYVVDDEVNT